MTVSDLLEQPCNKSDNINKIVIQVDKQCEDNLLADLLQDVRLLRVYKSAAGLLQLVLRTSAT